MKSLWFVILMILSTSICTAQTLNRQVRSLAADITRAYLEDREALLFRPRIGVAGFSEETQGAVDNAVGSLLTALLTEEFSRSTTFLAVERQNLEALLKEMEFSVSDLADQSTAPQIGQLQGVELLLLGSVSEVGDRYLVTARLVEVETGRIAASSRAEIDGPEIEQESLDYIASTFQTPYGISLAPAAMLLYEVGGDGNLLSILSIDAGYRVNSWLSVSLGYAHLGTDSLKGLDDERITVTDDLAGTHQVTRYFRLSGDGLKLAVSGNLSPTHRLSLAAQLATVVYLNATLEQDLPEFPVWVPDGAGGLTISNERIIVTGFNHRFTASYQLVAGAEYLVSRRLSVFGRLGGFWLPTFTPTSFESSGRVQDNTVENDNDIDLNGTFPQYQGFNFSRSSTGERIEFGAAGLAAELGVAIHF